MRKIIFTILFFITTAILALWTSGCADTPKVAPRSPWYKTEANLRIKEKAIFQQIKDHISTSGLLLYEAITPVDKNFLHYSHSVRLSDGDQPAWHGYLMASEAFKMSVTGEDSDLLHHLVDGLLSYYEVTGEKGLFGRSVFPDYTGSRLNWMPDKEDRTVTVNGKDIVVEGRPTRFWMRGANGAWWRNGLAKDHFNLAIFGCAIPLALHRRGDIELSSELETKLKDFMLPAVRRFVNNDFKLVDFDGEVTEFGNLSPQVANGFNMILDLHVLKSASFYDEDIKKVYEQKLSEWDSKVKVSLRTLGWAVKNIVGNNRGNWDKPSFSDMQALGCASFSLLFQEEDEEQLRGIRKGLKGLWAGFLKHERNPMFIFPYAKFVDSGFESTAALSQVVQDLRDFPLRKWRAGTGRVETEFIQPLANRPMTSNYWKQNVYRVPKGPVEVSWEQGSKYAAMDYLLAYWQGRYLNLIPRE